MEGYHEKDIRLETVEDVTEFVAAAERCDFRVNVCKNKYRFIVDGKSMLGVIAIVGDGLIRVAYDGEDHRFNEILKKFQCAQIA